MLTRILSAFGFEKRSAYDPRLAPDAWGRAISTTGYVSPSSVFSNLPVALRAVALKSELIGSTSLKMYRRLPNGDRVRETDHPLADVLSDLANPRTTAMEAREFWSRSLDTSGNSFSIIERDRGGQVIALWPVESSKVQVEQLENGRLRYRVSGPRGATVYLQEDILHIRGASDDGVLGVSTLTRARGALGLAISLNETSENLAANGMRIAGIIMHPGKLTEKAKDGIRDGMEKRHSGPQNAGRFAVFEEGMKFAPTQFSAADSELLDSRKLSAEDVCRIFGVPPASVGISTSVSYGSAQAAAADLVQNTLAPLAARIEQALMRCCLTPEGRRAFILEHDLSSLLRSDPVARFNTYLVGRNAGILTQNEARRFENLPSFGPVGDDPTPLRATAPQAEPPIATIKT